MSAEFLSFIPQITLQDYTYHLPAERIAAYPLPDRDASKLLYAHAPTGTITHRTFRDIEAILPPHTLLVMNNSRVISARIFCVKSSGGAAEILCLTPITPSHDPALTLQATGTCRWQCMIGGRNIRTGDTLSLPSDSATIHALQFSAVMIEKNGAEALVEFSWQPATHTFGEILEQLGRIPLPPYMNRPANEADAERYQTVYAFVNGSVAAPTAGLHFTDRVRSTLRAHGVQEEFVTLHVGAGTFKPMQSDAVDEHTMHIERITVSRSTIQTLIEHTALYAEHGTHPVVAVGTTSLRTLESLYVFSAQIALGIPSIQNRDELFVGQWDAFALRHQGALPSAHRAFSALAEWMDSKGMSILHGETQLMIVPGYPFMVCSALMTNFHQPQSTLILLVAAFVGDLWQTIYQEALAQDYRFLSYGDTSLLVRSPLIPIE